MNPIPAHPLEDIVAWSEIPVPNPAPYTHISAAIVVWNDPDRVARLLDHLRPWFDQICVGVQCDGNPQDDPTYLAVKDRADHMVIEGVRGFGDATFGPRVLPLVTSKWTLKVDADEWPTDELLGSLSSATWAAEHSDEKPYDGVWIPFRSWVEGIEYEEQHNHLRLFHTRLGWPPMLHSTPPAKRPLLWHTGHFLHERSLDEMMQDYLRYWKVGRGTQTWDDHNRAMMFSACTGTAAQRGWDFVKAHEWWPQVEAIAFKEGIPA